ncbi:MAG: ABC transporter substrate-binding protein [Deinococcota bacterium]
MLVKCLAMFMLFSLGVTQTPKTITISEVFWPSAGFAIETDDARSLSRWGVTETLVKVDFDGQMVPMLASSWEQTSPLEWVFTLREDVSFQNGEPFNAEAVVTAFEYLFASDAPPRGLDPESIEGVEALSEFQVAIRTTSEDALMANRLISPSFGILAPAAYESMPPSPFGTGTGPFTLTEVIPEQRAELVKHETYWDGPVQLDAATVLSIPDADTGATMLRAGEVDIASSLPIPLLPILEADPNLTVVNIAQPRTRTLYLNNASGPLADVNVRRAVLQAIDKEAIVAAVLEGVGQAAVGPFASNEAWVNPDLDANTYDPEAAKATLAAAGYEEGELDLRIFTYPGRPSLPPTAVVLQDMLSQVGFNVEVRIASYGIVEADVLEGDFDIFIVSRGHSIDTYDPEGFLTADFSCGGGYNLNLYCNEEVDALLAQARGTADSDARFDIYRDIQQIVVEDDVASIFLNYTEQSFAYRNGVLNYQPHLLENYTLTAELDVE